MGERVGTGVGFGGRGGGTCLFASVERVAPQSRRFGRVLGSTRGRSRPGVGLCSPRVRVFTSVCRFLRIAFVFALRPHPARTPSERRGRTERSRLLYFCFDRMVLLSSWFLAAYIIRDWSRRYDRQMVNSTKVRIAKRVQEKPYLPVFRFVSFFVFVFSFFPPRP